MTMFGYYALHTLKNQIKKLFKTWVLVFFVVCMLIGGIIGAGAAFLFDDEESAEPPAIEETQPGYEEEEFSTEESLATRNEIIELVAGGVVIAMLTYFVLSADKNGSAIFQPADVCLLFPSPLKPQTVLMFRVVSKLGGAAFAGVYMLLQLPNLTINLGLTMFAALMMILAWSFTLIIAELLNVLLYSIGTTYSKIKPKIRPVTYAVLGIIGVSYFAFWKLGGLEPFEAATRFFNGTATRYIPIFGWIKGVCMYAIEENYLGAAICSALLLLTTVGIIYLIWHTKADFYEDAMAKSEETAELLAVANEETGFKRRKKDRDDRLLRDGMKYGSGANAFFFKAMYNRFRFAHLHFFTKTSETYLVAAAAAALASKYVFEFDGLLIVALALAAIAFFRSLANPFEQDLQSCYFKMIPESTWKKLLWSLLGGSATCLLDLIPGMLIATIIMGASPLSALAWILFVVSIDFYSTTVGTFITTSVPVSAGKAVKQIVQIMFIYFGLIPDIAFIAIGFSDYVAAISISSAIVLAAVFNVAIGLFFFALIPLFLEPGSKKASLLVKELSAEEQKGARKCFSRIGLSVFAIVTIASVLQVALVFAQGAFFPETANYSWTYWLMTFAPIYVVAVPISLLIIKKVPVKKIEPKKLTAGNMAVCVIISMAMMYLGNILGTVITSVLQVLLGNGSMNPVMSMAMSDSLFLKILFLVVLAPIIEEFVFRRQLIDRMRLYGEKQAVIVSALMFGLFHGNLSQFFYAFALGLVFGYVYLHTGKLRYSVMLHMFINFLGSIAAPALLQKATEAGENSVWNIIFIGYAGLLIVLTVVGIVLLCLKSRKVNFETAELELAKGTRFKTVFINVGMTLFVLSSLALFIISFVGLM